MEVHDVELAIEGGIGGQHLLHDQPVIPAQSCALAPVDSAEHGGRDVSPRQERPFEKDKARVRRCGQQGIVRRREEGIAFRTQRVAIGKGQGTFQNEDEARYALCGGSDVCQPCLGADKSHRELGAHVGTDEKGKLGARPIRLGNPFMAFRGEQGVIATDVGTGLAKVGVHRVSPVGRMAA